MGNGVQDPRVLRRLIALHTKTGEMINRVVTGQSDRPIDTILDPLQAIVNPSEFKTARLRYADEEVDSTYTYLPEYDGPRPIEEQITALTDIFGLDPTRAIEYARDLPALPSGAEGWFAIPSSEGLQKLFPQFGNDAERYCAGVRLVLKKIAETREFHNYRDGQITPDRLRVHARTAHALDLVAENQPGDTLVVPAQLGVWHRSRSVRRARECFGADEFGLGSLAVGSIVLMHPNRLVRWEQLHMDCPGDEFDYPGAAARFGCAPIFDFGSGLIEFNAHQCDYANRHYGSASAFVPPTRNA